MSYCINQIFLAVGTTATAAFGIWIKLQNFGYMPVYGLNNGSIAVLSYNYGAKQLDRVKKGFSLTMRVGVAATTLIMVVVLIFTRPLLSMFSASENMYAIGTSAIRICGLSMPVTALSLVCSAAFQGLGRSRYTLVINVCRQLAILVPVAWVLSLFGNLTLIWFAFIIAEGATAAIAMVLCRKLMGGLNAELGQG